MTDSLLFYNASQDIDLDGSEQSKKFALQLIQQARQEICFFVDHLDAIWFNHADILNSLSDFAHRNARTSVKLLLRSSNNNIQQSGGLIALVQRLPSSMAIRIAATQHQDLRQLFLFIDDHGYLFFKDHAHYSGQASLNNRQKVRLLRQIFYPMWEHGVSDINTRRL